MRDLLSKLTPHNSHKAVEDVHERYTAASDILSQLIRDHASADDACTQARRAAQDAAVNGASSVELAKMRQAARDAERTRSAIADEVNDQEAAVSALETLWRAEMKKAQEKNREQAHALFDKALRQTAETVNGALSDSLELLRDIELVIVANSGTGRIELGHIRKISQELNEWARFTIDRFSKQ